MYHASLHNSIDAPWNAMEPIRVGDVPSREPAPDGIITVEADGLPHTRVDIYIENHVGPFCDLIVWGRFVVLGWNDSVHLIDPATRSANTIGCDGYYGHLYPLDRYLLIASSSELICMDHHGERRWLRSELGIDGVIVDGVVGGVVEGRGEWDPPGGWQPFRLDLETGVTVTADHRPGMLRRAPLLHEAGLSRIRSGLAMLRSTASDRSAPGQPSHQIVQYPMLQYLDPVPFTIENDAHFGLSETQGLLSCDGGNLLIEYRIADTIVGAMKTPSKTVAIPFDEIRSIRLERKFLGMVNRIVIRTRSQGALDFFPDAKGGMVTLALKRGDREPAESLCLAVQEAVVRQRSLKLGDELDRLQS